MARILVTGSTTGIGLETARTLQGLGHDVVWHARSKERAADLGSDAEVVVGDLASLQQRRETGDGIERIFQVNVLAPYVLTALMARPQRLVYLSSSLESGGLADLADLQYRAKPWDGRQAYSDSKLHDVALAWAVARRWPDVYSNAVDPGWVRTRLGGPYAIDDLPIGADTQVWLATGAGGALVTGRYFKRRRVQRPNPAAGDIRYQDGLLRACADLSEVE